MPPWSQNETISSIPLHLSHLSSVIWFSENRVSYFILPFTSKTISVPQILTSFSCLSYLMETQSPEFAHVLPDTQFISYLPPFSTASLCNPHLITYTPFQQGLNLKEGAYSLLFLLYLDKQVLLEKFTHQMAWSHGEYKASSCICVLFILFLLLFKNFKNLILKLK